MLRLIVDRLPKPMIVQHSESLEGLFLGVFDLRRIQLSPLAGHNLALSEIRKVEDVISEIAMSMVYKCNDATFRPIFARMLEWATFSTSKKDKKATIHRQTMWYTFLVKFFSSLKVCAWNTTRY